MILEPKVIAGPIKEPISLIEAKLACKVDGDTEDALFTGIWIPAAREYTEGHTSTTLHETTLAVRLNCWPHCSSVDLPRATPLIEIVSVIYRNSSGDSTTWDAANYIIDNSGRVGRLVLADGGSWPTDELYPADGIEIQYRAGIETSSPETEAPAWAKWASLLLVASMYDNRSAEVHPDRSTMDTVWLRYGVDEIIGRNRAESHIF